MQQTVPIQVSCQMKELLRKIRARLPGRSDRQWRYVSPQRRGLGIVLLVLLVTIFSAYFYMTSDSRIRRMAINFLKESTGMQVSIRSARFRFFKGVELNQVSIGIPGDPSRLPLFMADKVVLKHRPFSLFVDYKPDFTEVICDKPMISLEFDLKGRLTTGDLLKKGGQDASPDKYAWKGALPPVKLLDGIVVTYERDGDARREIDRRPLTAFVVPRANHVYLAKLMDDPFSGKISGMIELDLLHGEFKVSGDLPIDTIKTVLPLKYRQWWDAISPAGDLRVAGRSGSEGAQGSYEAELVGVALKLPKEYGQIELADVSGMVVFAPEGITLKKISGRTRQFGDAQFELDGRYEGYAEDSPFNLELKIHNLDIAAGKFDGEGVMAKIREIRDIYSLTGRTGLRASVSRDKDGRIDMHGQALPDGMTGTYKYFQYRMDDISGSLSFKGDTVDVTGITARHGQGRLTITGKYEATSEGEIYDILINAKDLALEKELRDSLKPNFQNFWDRISPGGSAGAIMRVVRTAPKEPERTDVELILDGKTSLSYAGFPYLVEKVFGKVNITGKRVDLIGLTGSRGPMTCRIDGAITDLDTPDPLTDIRVAIRDLPLDRTLAEAAGRQGRDSLENLRPAGKAKTVAVRVTQDKKGDIDYDASVELEDAEFFPTAFPYKISGVSGPIHLTPSRVLIDGSLTGRHEKTDIVLKGQFSIGDKTGIDLRADCKNLLFNRELYDACPAGVKKVIDQLSPAGIADMTLYVRYDMPDMEADQVDYDIVLKAREMEICYEDFPYTFRGVRGTMTARPGLVLLDGFVSEHGKMRTALTGRIDTSDEKTSTALNIDARNVPVDKELLAALPRELNDVVGRIKPGGLCDVYLGDFRLVRTGGGQPSSRPASSQAAQSAPASQPEGKTNWSIGPGPARAGNTDLPPKNSSIVAADVTIDIGFGPKTINGSLIGKLARTDAGLSIDADIEIDKMSFGEKKLTDMRGKLVKAPKSDLIQIKDLRANAHGGQVAANDAFVRLSEPAILEVRLDLENVKLQELFGPADPAKPSTIEGLLMGRIALSVTPGKPQSVKAEGALSIYKAKFSQLPVVLGLLQVIYLSIPVPGQSPLTAGEVTYQLTGSSLVLTEISLSGPGISVIGSGTIDMDSEKIKLYFVTGPPGKVPKRMRNLIEEFLDAIAPDIAQIEITGTMKETKTRTITFRNVDSVINRLLHPTRPGE
ncbi:MAG: hypothetical protein HZA50_01295 [Planctomycetes bacterium]|nr:hypothetical protein [Planctomycetota bacterium]